MRQALFLIHRLFELLKDCVFRKTAKNQNYVSFFLFYHLRASLKYFKRTHDVSCKRCIVQWQTECSVRSERHEHSRSNSHFDACTSHLFRTTPQFNFHHSRLLHKRHWRHSNCKQVSKHVLWLHRHISLSNSVFEDDRASVYINHLAVDSTSKQDNIVLVRAGWDNGWFWNRNKTERVL